MKRESYASDCLSLVIDTVWYCQLQLMRRSCFSALIMCLTAQVLLIMKMMTPILLMNMVSANWKERKLYWQLTTVSAVQVFWVLCNLYIYELVFILGPIYFIHRTKVDVNDILGHQKWLCLLSPKCLLPDCKLCFHRLLELADSMLDWLTYYFQP